MNKILSLFFFLLFIFFGFLALENIINLETDFEIIQLSSPKIEYFQDDNDLEDLKEYYSTEKRENPDEQNVVEINPFASYESEDITSSQIIRLTNIEREKYQLNNLIENQRLNDAAKIKAKDMLDRQYFAHSAPTGEEVSDLAVKVGYSYLLVGENLAKGNFSSSEDLVTGWMNSPNHRDNILKSGYTEIGAAAIKGDYKGNKIWMAVQIFGTPSEICPSPNQLLLDEINQKEIELSKVKDEIDFIGLEISEMKPARGKAYIDKVNQYNQMVEEYNLLREFISRLISVYNSQVEERNNCLENL